MEYALPPKGANYPATITASLDTDRHKDYSITKKASEIKSTVFDKGC